MDVPSSCASRYLLPHTLFASPRLRAPPMDACCRDVCNSGGSVDEKMGKLGQLMDESHASCR